MTRRSLVTGGAGFIGSHLVEALLQAGEEVVVLDDLSSGRPQNLPSSARLITGCITDRDALARAVEGADAIFHLAARVSVQACIDDWLASHRVNLGGSIAVMQAAAEAGGLPVIYASSAAIYGDQAGAPCREDMLPAPISPYGADKLGCEHQGRAMWSVHRLPSAGLRFFNVYGPRQDAASPYSGVVARFCANRLADRPHVVFGDGLQGRDFIYVGDVVRALIAARARLRRAPAQLVLNVCTGRVTTLLDLADTLDALSGRPPLPRDHQPARAGDIRDSRGVPDLARAETGFAAETPIGAGLATLWASLGGDQGNSGSA